MTERIAAIIPAYNRESTIERALESVVSQTLQPAEIIVVDDGSTDATATLAAQVDPRVRVISIENSGAAEARNVGVRATDAEWIAFLDSDDYWRPTHLAQSVSVMQRTDYGADVYFSDTTVVSDDGSISYFERAGFEARGDFQLFADATDLVLAPRQPLLLQASLISRQAFERVGGLDANLRVRQDTHFFLGVGIGAPMAAVCAVGCVMTSDVPAHSRNTGAMNDGTITYQLATSRLYADILERFEADLPAHHRRDLQRRLAHAQLRASRLLFRGREYRAGLSSLIHSVRTDRSLFEEAVARRLRRKP